MRKKRALYTTESSVECPNLAGLQLLRNSRLPSQATRPEPLRAALCRAESGPDVTSVTLLRLRCTLRYGRVVSVASVAP